MALSASAAAAARLVKYGEAVKLAKLQGGTPEQQEKLVEAAKKGQSKRIKRLLKAGAVVALEGANGSTALHWACYKGHVDAVVTMVKWVQRWKRKHPDPNNALPNARIYNRRSVGKNQPGWTPLHWACWGKSEGVVDLLVNEYKCDLRCKDKSGLTPLHLACTADNAAIVGHLVAPGGTFLSHRHMRDTLGAIESGLGNTPLHVACSAGAEKVCRILIDCNAPLDRLNHNGACPVDIAIAGGLTRIVTLLNRAKLRLKRHGEVDARKRQQQEAIAKMHADAATAKPESQMQRDKELGFGLAGLQLEDKKRERRKSTRLEQSR